LEPDRRSRSLRAQAAPGRQPRAADWSETVPYLTPAEARRLYDRSQLWREAQAFYVRRALDELVGRAGFEQAASVFEFGCGTGLFAERLLAEHLPERSRYLGIDVSPKRARRARERLRRWESRAEVRLADGSMLLPFADCAFDRFVSNYVLDLLRPADAQTLLSEARRVLVPNGRICVTGLTGGEGLLSRVVMLAWKGVWSLRPELVGGCRPIELAEALASEEWELEHRSAVSSLGIASEIVVARNVGGDFAGGRSR
jgi:SAM-dependent methyltransferase